MGASEQWYRLYFALNAIGLISGPLLYLWLPRYVCRTTFITAGFTIMIAGGVLICLIGNFGPLVFALALLPASLMGSSVRPPGAHLMLEQQKDDTGSASALIGCCGLLFGSVGMILVSLDGNNLVLIIGAINVAVGLVCLAGWMLIGRLNW
jgi:MFS transporter, DHA1 family, multidrug resistance protein